jgi:hypothetical protein
VSVFGRDLTTVGPFGGPASEATVRVVLVTPAHEHSDA